jgi:hypothetical protein
MGRDQALIREGDWIVVGEGSARVVAQVVEIEGEMVRVPPLPGCRAPQGSLEAPHRLSEIT